MARQREYALPLRAHIEAMEYLAHIHGQKRHGHAVGGDACRHFKVPHLHAVADYVGGERQHGHQQALIDYIHAQSA